MKTNSKEKTKSSKFKYLSDEELKNKLKKQVDNLKDIIEEKKTEDKDNS